MWPLHGLQGKVAVFFLFQIAAVLQCSALAADLWHMFILLSCCFPLTRGQHEHLVYPLLIASSHYRHAQVLSRTHAHTCSQRDDMWPLHGLQGKVAVFFLFQIAAVLQCSALAADLRHMFIFLSCCFPLTRGQHEHLVYPLLIASSHYRHAQVLSRTHAHTCSQRDDMWPLHGLQGKGAVFFLFQIAAVLQCSALAADLWHIFIFLSCRFPLTRGQHEHLVYPLLIASSHYKHAQVLSRTHAHTCSQRDDMWPLHGLQGKVAVFFLFQIAAVLQCSALAADLRHMFIFLSCCFPLTRGQHEHLVYPLLIASSHYKHAQVLSRTHAHTCSQRDDMWPLHGLQGKVAVFFLFQIAAVLQCSALAADLWHMFIFLSCCFPLTRGQHEHLVYPLLIASSHYKHAQVLSRTHAHTCSQRDDMWPLHGLQGKVAVFFLFQIAAVLQCSALAADLRHMFIFLSCCFPLTRGQHEHLVYPLLIASSHYRHAQVLSRTHAHTCSQRDDMWPLHGLQGKVAVFFLFQIAAVLQCSALAADLRHMFIFLSCCFPLTRGQHEHLVYPLLIASSHYRHAQVLSRTHAHTCSQRDDMWPLHGLQGKVAVFFLFQIAAVLQCSALAADLSHMFIFLSCCFPLTRGQHEHLVYPLLIASSHYKHAQVLSRTHAHTCSQRDDMWPLHGLQGKVAVFFLFQIAAVLQCSALYSFDLRARALLEIISL